MQTIEFCRLQLNFKLPSEQTACCRKKFASPEFVRMNLVKFSCAQRPAVDYYGSCKTGFMPLAACMVVSLQFLLQLIRLSRSFGLSLQRLFESFDMFV